MIHIHARKPDGTPSLRDRGLPRDHRGDPAEVGDVIVNYSTGAIGVPRGEADRVPAELKPDIAALNMGSMNYAKYSRAAQGVRLLDGLREQLREIIELLEAMNELGIKPEHECFDIGHVGNLDAADRHGRAEGAAAGRLRDGRHRRHPADARATSRDGREHPGGPTGSHDWGVIGISRDQWMLVAAALTLGGTIRVGLEDNFYLPDGEMARSNGELIAKARQMTEDVGRRPATVQEARAMLGRPPARGAAA